MANHKSAAKRARQDAKKGAHNGQTKKTIRTFEKKLRVLIGEKKSKEASELLKSYASRISKAASKRILHSSNASRKISRLSAQVNQISK